MRNVPKIQYHTINDRGKDSVDWEFGKRHRRLLDQGNSSGINIDSVSASNLRGRKFAIE